ncbi:hypothetical protein ACOMHN_062596 [Nucella lapillus]
MDLETYQIVYLAVEMTISVVSLVANGLILTALLRNPSIHNITNILVGNLALGDILVNLIVAPISFVSFLGLPRNFYACVFLNSLAVVFTTVSVLTLFFITMERLMAVMFPHKWRALVHKSKKAVMMAGVTWILSFLIGLVPLMGWYKGKDDFEYCSFTAVIPLTYMVYLVFMGVILPCLLCMLCVYTSIFIVLLSRMDLETYQIVHLAVELTISVVSLVANGLILMALLRNSSIRNTTNILVGNLALGDVLVNLIVAPTSFVSFLGLPRNFYACLFLNSLAVIFTKVSVFTLFFITMERLMAVMFPHKWRALVHKKKKAVMMAGVTWILGLLIGLVPLMGWYKGKDDFEDCSFIAVIPLTFVVYLVFMGVILPCLLCMLCVYTSIFIILRRQKLRWKVRMARISILLSFRIEIASSKPD